VPRSLEGNPPRCGAVEDQKFGTGLWLSLMNVLRDLEYGSKVWMKSQWALINSKINTRGGKGNRLFLYSIPTLGLPV
jgi:hypothetical protein